MNTKALRLAFTAVTASVALATAVNAGHPWPLYHGNLNRTGQTAAEGPVYIDIKWVKDFGSSSVVNYASPTIDEQGRVYIGTADGVLHVLKSDGSTDWTYNTGATQSTFFGGSNTPSAAIASDGSVVVLDAIGRVHKLNSSGQFIWKFDTLGNSADSHPAILADGTILVATYFYIPPVGANAYLTSISPTGQQNWRADNPGVGHILSGPMVDSSGNIYVAAFDRLLKYNSVGQLQWTYNNNGPHMYGSPTLDPFGHVLLADQTGFVRAVRQSNGTLAWSYRIGTFSQAPLAVSSSGMAVGCAWPASAAGLQTLAGDPVWSRVTTGRARSAPSLDAKDRAYFGVDGGMIYAVDKRGKMVWSLNIGNNTRSTPAFDAQGNMIIATDTWDGAKLICFGSGFDSSKTVAGARSLPDGPVTLKGKPVTYVGDGFYYIQDWDPVAGIKVVSANNDVQVGDVVDVQGTLSSSSLERLITADADEIIGTCVLPEVRYLNNKAVGGGAIGLNPGVTGAAGLNTVGVVVKTYGKLLSSEESPTGGYVFWIDDGSGVSSTSGKTGIKVYNEFQPFDEYVAVTGVVALEEDSGRKVPVILTRDFDDIEPLD